MHNLILHIPHGSTVIPAEYRPLFYGDDADLAAELLAMTDLYTDDLFALPCPAAIMPVSRLVCDAERFRDPARECMTAKGMWVCYTRTSAGQPLKRADAAHCAEILARYYDPHHEKLTALTDAALQARGRALILDCHSFASRALPYEDASLPRPDVCIGTDGYHTPAVLTELCRERLTAAGYTVGVNTPFAGCLVPMKHYRRDARVMGLMLEINRGLYMDEASGEKMPGYGRLERVLAELAEELDAVADEINAAGAG